MDVQAFRTKYDAWLREAKPLLLEADWKGAFANYPYVVYRDAPWTPLRKPLAECRVGLLTTAGIYVDGEQEPFAASNIEGDWHHREVPVDTPAERLAIAHDHFNHRYVLEDLNTVYPVDRLKELAAEGVIGALVSPAFSISGYCPHADRLVTETAPRIVEAIRDARADLVLHVPV